MMKVFLLYMKSKKGLHYSSDESDKKIKTYQKLTKLKTRNLNMLFVIEDSQY